MLEIIGAIVVVIAVIIAALYLLFRYFVFSIRNNAINQYELTPLDCKVLLCAEDEYRQCSGGSRLPPAHTQLHACMIKNMPLELKQEVVDGKMSYMEAADIFQEKLPDIGF